MRRTKLNADNSWQRARQNSLIMNLFAECTMAQFETHGSKTVLGTDPCFVPSVLTIFNSCGPVPQNAVGQQFFDG